MKILIVDDDADGQILFSHMLQLVGLEVEGVPSAEQAMRHLDKFKYDAIIIDLMLPGIDGLELLKVIRRNPHTVRLLCLAVTAFDSPHIRKRALEVGFDGYFVKPVDPIQFPQDLLALLQS
jgi:CheY-like chemotaxis protein